MQQAYPDTCGNGRIDRGEECDSTPPSMPALFLAGSSFMSEGLGDAAFSLNGTGNVAITATSIDGGSAGVGRSCCDAATCLAEPTAACVDGPCCTAECQIAPPGLVCRPAEDVCDLDEVCNGRQVGLSRLIPTCIAMRIGVNGHNSCHYSFLSHHFTNF
ncbi:unnamed protein product [Protopolystoma xenopodis]|uniref:Disintegrin domain-containing protein n=1 Tax=Protopolystoma xenopodis TaxID=117903 RepID=A0A448WEC9_9PLAT|nr:unnamed protein product [Protopolystoma xenopodis]